MSKRDSGKPYGSAEYRSFMSKEAPRMLELAYLERCIGDAVSIIEQNQPLQGPIFTEQGVMDVREALVMFQVRSVVYRFGTWVVTEDGIACLVRHYPLTRSRLAEHQDWASHLAEQSWANLWDVVRVLVVAKHRETQHDDHSAQSGGSYLS